MKKLLPFLILLSLILSGAWAVEKTKPASSKSTRSSFSVPQAWHVSYEPSYSFAVSLPNETVTIADSPQSTGLVAGQSLISDLTLNKNFKGALLAHNVLPSYFNIFMGVKQGVLDADNLLDKITDSTFKEAKAERTSYENNGFRGASYFIRRGNTVLEVQLLFDAEDNILITISFFSAEYAEDIADIKKSFSYSYFTREEQYSTGKPMLPADFFKDIIEVNLPRSWWVIVSPSGQLIASPDFTYFITLQNGTTADTQGMLVMNYSTEDRNGVFKELLLQDDITEEKLIAVLDVLQWSHDRMTMDIVEKWQSTKKVSGLIFGGKITQGDKGLEIFFRIYFIERQGTLYIFTCIADQAGKEGYIKLMDAIMATTRWVGK